MKLPSDSDVDVLGRLEEEGFDFGQECLIEFSIDFQDWPLADDVVGKIRRMYLGCRFIELCEEGRASGATAGYVQFQMWGVLSYELVMVMQAKICREMKMYGGWCESWHVLEEAGAIGV